MKIQALTAIRARKTKLRYEPALVSRAMGNAVATAKLTIQLVKVASDAAVPITCSGYISALTHQGVDENPMPKAIKKRTIPVKAISVPIDL